MSSASKQQLSFDNPPIFEVICGIHYESVGRLDALSQGLFWADVRAEFPTAEVKSPLNSSPVQLAPGPPRIRSWLKSEENDFLIQVQDDRFYLNWRRSDQDYPRFGSVDEPRSIVSETLKRFRQFSEFCQGNLSVKPKPSRIEVAKINILPKGEYWTSLTELGELLPALGGLIDFLSNESPQVSVRFEATTDSPLRTEIDTVKLIDSDSQSEKDALRVEIRTQKSAVEDTDLVECLTSANSSLNEHFLKLFPDAESVFAGGS